MIKDYFQVNAPNVTAVIAMIVSDLQAWATLVLTVVSITCTIIITLRKLKSKKED